MKKRFFLLVLAVLILCSFSSCSLVGRTNDDSGTIDGWFEQIVNALKERDESSLKKVFSQRAVIDAVDMDASIQVLFDFIEGEVVSFRDRGSSQGSASKDRAGNAWKRIQSNYIIETDVKTYRLAIQGYSIDTADPDNIGVYSLYITEAQGYDIYEGYWGDGRWTAGIVIEEKEPEVSAPELSV